MGPTVGAALDARKLIDVDPVEAVGALAASRQPYLIGIRHHSPVLACAVPHLLDQAAPDLILLELPAELQDWLPWLAAEDLKGPVALAAARRDGRGLVFYPYADFSPELAAVRWARQHGVDVEAFDLPLGIAVDDNPRGRTRLAPERPAPLTDFLRVSANADDADELWDRSVEARAPGADVEAIRRAALAIGWSLRFELSTWAAIPASDVQREAWMRQRLHAALARGVGRPAAVVGAFHASALLEPRSEVEPKWPKPVDVVTSLVPYAFELLDSRTGYPAGIRDPEWQQSVWEGGGSVDAILRAVSLAAVRICREMRKHGHAAGVPDARETIRLATDLARLRDLPAPGRREVIEALQTTLAQGELYGRGRAVAAAMETVLVGTRRGRLASGTPRSGLGPHVQQLLAELRLPGPDDPYPLEFRLDPLRSDLDRRRHVTIQRLTTCQVPYATPISVDADLLTGRWVLRWTSRTSAVLELSGHRGVTLEQAAEGTLRARIARAENANSMTSRLRLETLQLAAECGLPELVQERLIDIEQALPHQATLPELVDALDLCDRIGRRHVPGFQPAALLQTELSERLLPTLIAAAVAAIDGLAGSDNLDDARALLALGQRVGAGGGLRLRFALESLERDASPLMQGAAGAVRVFLGHLEPDAFGLRMSSWIDAASAADQGALARRLAGALSLAAPLLEAAPSITERLVERVAALEDTAFLQRLPALREGFEVLSPAARRRFLASLSPRLDVRLDKPATVLAEWAAADLYARQVLLNQLPRALGPDT
jgi:hypothetical protein